MTPKERGRNTYNHEQMSPQTNVNNRKSSFTDPSVDRPKNINARKTRTEKDRES